MSRSFGSSCAASRCAHSKSSRLPFIAVSSASIDFCRPTNSGTTMCGNTTMSRSGSSGSDLRAGGAPVCVTRDFLGSSSSRKIPMALFSVAETESSGLRLLLEHQQRLAPLLGERGDHGQPPDELGDQSELEQVLGLHLVKPLALRALDLARDVRVEPHPLHADPALDDRLEVAERAAAQEQDVRGVDLEEL